MSTEVVGEVGGSGGPNKRSESTKTPAPRGVVDIDDGKGDTLIASSNVPLETKAVVESTPSKKLRRG